MRAAPDCKPPPTARHAPPPSTSTSHTAAHRAPAQAARAAFLQCVFITAVPSTKLFACVGGGQWKDMCYERLRAEACVD
jgi:hypothetical protein